jgi:hypothetical protein
MSNGQLIKLVSFVRVRAPLVVVLLLCLAALLYAAARLAWAVLVSPHRAWALAVSFDQLANAAANGDPDETISSRAGKARMLGRRWGCVLCKVLDALDPQHCDRFIERDRGRRV